MTERMKDSTAQAKSPIFHPENIPSIQVLSSITVAIELTVTEKYFNQVLSSSAYSFLEIFFLIWILCTIIHWLSHSFTV